MLMYVLGVQCTQTYAWGVDLRQSIVIVAVNGYRVVFALIYRSPDTSFTVAYINVVIALALVTSY